MKLQSTLITQNTTNQEEIKSVIRSMKPEITSIFGAALQQEVSTLLENLGGMTDIIEANFSQIKDILQSHKEDIIKAITKEKEDAIKSLAYEITDLKSKLDAKEVQI